MGERVRVYLILGQTGQEDWSILSNGTAIGHKKIDPIDPVLVSALKFVNLYSSDTPQIRNFAAFFIGPF